LQPFLAIGRTFLRQHHVHDLEGLVAGLDRQLRQAPGIRRDSAFS